MQTVVAGGERAHVLHRRGHGRGAGVARSGEHRRAGNGKELLAQVAVQVLAEHMLIVECLRHAQRDAPEAVLHGIERIAAKAQQPAQASALYARGGDQPGSGPVLVAHLDALRVLVGACGDQGEGGAADHDRLAVADENVVAAVAFPHHRGGHFLVERIHQRVALIAQIVRRLLRGLAFDREDALVELRDLHGVAVDRSDAGGDLRVEAVADFGDLLVQVLKARAERVRRREQRLARRDGLRMRGDVRDPAEKILQRRRKARARVAEQGVELLDLRVIGVELAALRLRQRDLVGERVAVDAPDRAHRYALAEETDPGKLRGIGYLDDFLTREPGGRGVADIVAGRDQARLSGVHAAHADAEYAVSHLGRPRRGAAKLC